MKNLTADVVVVGTGVSGLYLTLNLPKDKKVIMITKSTLEECDSFLAQGGICVLKDINDYDSYFEDTMRAGHYENNKESVDIMIRSSAGVIHDLVGYGVGFAKHKDGTFKYTREGAHNANRILFHKDVTGKEITSHLLEAVKKLDNVTLLEHTTMVDLVEDKKSRDCEGIICRDRKGEIFGISANFTVLACGGIGGVFKHSTNFPHLTGDGLAVCLKHQVKLQNPDYIQIHPTTFYTEKPGRSFLISESVRGEGALLYDANGQRFVNELLPRDVVSEAIFKQMKKDGTDHVWLSMKPISEHTIKTHFHNIDKYCLEQGYDVTKQNIPVVPAQHYFMGGIDVDSYSHTSMNRLFAVGETACNGVHGKNRLASNSLLESMVFARRAAMQITCTYVFSKRRTESFLEVDAKDYEDYQKLSEEYKQLVLDEIERMKKYHEQHNHEA